MSRRACCERGRARFSLGFRELPRGDPVPNFSKNTHHESMRLQIFDALGVQLFPIGAPLARSCIAMTHSAASQSGRLAQAVRDLRERGSEMSVQRRSFVSTGPTRDDPAVIQIWAEWRRDGSGLRQGSPGVLVSVTVLSTWFIVLIYGRLTLTWGSALACLFS